MRETVKNQDQALIEDFELSLSSFNITSSKNQAQTLANRSGTAKTIRFEANTKLRIHLTYIFTSVIFLWLASVMTILFFNAVLHLKLSDQVLTILLTTTSINVIGMMLIILNNLFPKK